MASYMRPRCFAQFLSISQRGNYPVSILKRSEKHGCSYFPLWLSPPRRSISAEAEFPSLSSSSLSSPLLLLPPEQVSSNNNRRVVNIPLFSLADNQVVKLPNRILPEEISDAHCAGSSHGWLAYVNARKCFIYLANIFSPSVSPQIIQLPTIESLPCVRSVVRDSSSNDVKEYNYHNSPESPDRLSWLLITRFAMSSAPKNGNNNCRVMISNGMLSHLAFCSIGDTSWTPLENPLDEGYEEIIYSNKDRLFYVLTHMGHVEAWDLRDPTSPKRNLIAVENEYPSLSKSETDLRDLCRRQWHFAELSGGDILFVVRYFAFVGEDGTFVDSITADCFSKKFRLPYRTARFDIFKLKFENENAEYVTSIGDNALFLGNNHAFSLSTRDYPHLKPNSIYFTDNSQEYVISQFIFDYKHYPYGGHDVGVYNLEDYSVTPLYHPFEFKKILPPPIWVFPSKY